jgi:transposase
VTSLEEIKSNDGKTIAIVIKKSFKKDGTNFVSKSHFPLQLGINSYKKGDEIKPHVHRDREITIKNIQELVYIKSGELRVNLYNSNREFFKSFKLSTGDLVFFVDGGHGLVMLKDTTIMEVKQGPYLGKDQDKVLIE